MLGPHLDEPKCFCPHPSPGGEWRIKYNRAIREMDFVKKKLQQEFDDKVETEQQAKRHVERKVETNTHGVRCCSSM